jgi:hypothetical protein
VQREADARRFRCTRARVIVRRCADPAEAEHHVARCKRAPERFGDETRVVAEVLAPRELEPARTQRLDGGRDVLVLALPRQDLVTDDDGAEFHLQP